jgi:hypothetical protein
MEVTAGVMALECSEVLQEFFRSKRTRVEAVKDEG